MSLIKKIITAVDLFCGAGGTSTGLYNACHSMGSGVDLLAINHWQTAIDTHTANHPGARHICATLDSIRPEAVIKGGRLNIMVASPECTHHSVARGGRPVSDQLRASAWLILRWIESLRVDNILIENVQEFRNWGPLGVNNKPLKSRRGETYQAFLAALRSFGYSVEDNVLNAADYGDPTSRRRLFIMARRNGKKINWPEPTHGDPDLFTDRKPYRTAREIIDWAIKGQPISERKRPLSPNTMRRIVAGIKKFSGESFIVHMRGSDETQINGSAKSVDEPVPTITGSGGGHFNLCEPFIIHTTHEGGDRTHNKDHLGLCEPFIVKYYGNGEGCHSVNEPLDTITTKDRFGLVEVSGKYQIDIRFRMLQPHELAAAMSFENYKFTGNRGEQVKQIGNAVPVRIAQALCTSLLRQ